MKEEQTSLDEACINIRVPVRFTKRERKKLVVQSDIGDTQLPEHDTTLIRALVRGHRWQKLVDQGKMGDVHEIAKAEGLHHADISRAMRLTLLAPDIKKAILDGTQPPTFKLIDMHKSIPDLWEEQRELFGFV
jgi:hypothetical protein